MTVLTGQMGCAISTTGDTHRLAFLETCVRKWWEALPWGSPLFVTVDGDERAVGRVRNAVHGRQHAHVIRVGQPRTETLSGVEVRKGRLGVAANKNTGIEALMNYCDERGFPTVDHLFLSDDDTWPKDMRALKLHVDLHEVLPHSMVCWGRNREPVIHHRKTSQGLEAWAGWSWPRGVLLYIQRDVITRVGGMDERFGPGGHEHAEFSRRVHQAGLTPHPFCTPETYARHSRAGLATGAYGFWNAEDMPRPGEAAGTFQSRKRAQTSIEHEPGDWERINAVMAERDGDTRFVPFTADDNGRLSATLAGNLTA